MIAYTATQTYLTLLSAKQWDHYINNFNLDDFYDNIVKFFEQNANTDFVKDLLECQIPGLQLTKKKATVAHQAKEVLLIPLLETPPNSPQHICIAAQRLECNGQVMESPQACHSPVQLHIPVIEPIWFILPAPLPAVAAAITAINQDPFSVSYANPVPQQANAQYNGHERRNNAPPQALIIPVLPLLPPQPIIVPQTIPVPVPQLPAPVLSAAVPLPPAPVHQGHCLQNVP
ncbi:hypothetical protein CPB84DRAFT_1852100 [Gymnopilus junonius]|uniref:Uncharacterized protein n=1 Tax=Gymnopilus junonius TaxID=109634 RepID=A0A9P5NE35_GYMJU|nr:hypothetical protein CPB84DRAFT_1852100 [Gymnopilus junonius]